ncbi:MAG: hypothetical protein E7640_00580 [Ruminococcaceae bacterium]|nr:hypothetical protein [Oscillospiraceae bacterium]
MSAQQSNSTRGLTLTRAIFYTIAAFLLAVIQSTVGKDISLFGMPPQLTLALTAAAAYFYGPLTGGTVGLVSGIFTEALGAVGVSVLPLLYCLIGWFCGTVKAKTVGQKPKNFIGIMITVLFAALAGMGVTLVRLTVGVGRPNLLSALVYIVLPELLSTFIYGILIGLLNLFIYFLINKSKV